VLLATGIVRLAKNTVPQSQRQAADRIQGIFASLALLGLALTGGCAAVATLPIASVMGSPNATFLEIHSSTEVRLQDANFIVTKTNLVGQSKGFALLGILTIVPAKFSTAVSRLYTQAEMQQGRPQTLANLVMEKDSLYLILFSIPRTAIRADVIEFVPTNIPPRQPESRN
jgi:hypothetical protein